jgi:hypothetical protein
MASTVDTTKTIYIIVHGKKDLLDQVKEKLAFRGFEKEKMQNAHLDKAGNPGEYVAMIWPPMAPKEILVNEIIEPSSESEKNGDSGGNRGMGAWDNVGQRELYRIPLK